MKYRGKYSKYRGSVNRSHGNTVIAVTVLPPINHWLWNWQKSIQSHSLYVLNVFVIIKTLSVYVTVRGSGHRLW